MTAIPVIPSATDPIRRGNLRIKSLSLRELESNLSLAVDLTVSNERLSFTSIKDGESPVNMFSALGSTIEIPTLSVSSALCGDLSTSGITTFNELSVHGVSSQLSVNGYAFFEDMLSVVGDANFGSDMVLFGKASVGGAVDIVGPTQILSTLSAGGDTTLGSAVFVGGEVDIVGRTQVLSTLSVQDNAYLSSSLSVANIIMTPELGSDNTFILTNPIDSTSDAVHFYVDLEYPHTVVLKTAAGDIVFTQSSLALDDGNGGQFFRSTFSNSAGIFSSGGQVNGFTVSSNSPFLNYMTPLEVLRVSTESSLGVATEIHTPALGSSALTGGKKVPSLSVGGEIIVLESVSVGFDVTVSESLSVNKNIVSNTVSCANAFTSTLSASSLFVQSSTLDDITGTRLSVQNAFLEHVEISGPLSVAGKVELSLPDVQFLSTGMNMGQNKQLSIGGETFLNFLSVSMSHIDTLSVANTIATEISVHTLFVQQVTTNDPDESFDFHDDAVFQGDLTIEGKLFVSDILYTGSGGQFTIDNVARLTVEGVISTAGLIFEMTTPTSSSDVGTEGQMAVDTQFLYLCIQDNMWRRVTLSAF